MSEQGKGSPDKGLETLGSYRLDLDESQVSMTVEGEETTEVDTSSTAAEQVLRLRSKKKNTKALWRLAKARVSHLHAHTLSYESHHVSTCTSSKLASSL